MNRWFYIASVGVAQYSIVYILFARKVGKISCILNIFLAQTKKKDPKTRQDKKCVFLFVLCFFTILLYFNRCNCL